MDFVKFAIKELKLQSVPSRIVLVNNHKFITEHKSFGGYDTVKKEIIVYAGNRHPVDVMRTLAHELVHHRQHMSGEDMDGSTGSAVENEANAVAGVLLRKYRDISSDIFTYAS